MIRVTSTVQYYVDVKKMIHDTVLYAGRKVRQFQIPASSMSDDSAIRACCLDGESF